MSLAEIKLIATDMDGTLLDGKGELNPEFYSLYRQLRELDIHVAIASGRQYYNLKDIFSDIADDLIFISDNGSYMVDRGQVKLMQPMPHEQVRELILQSREMDDAHALLCGEKTAYIENQDQVFLRYLHHFFSEIKVVEDLTTVTHEPLIKFSICDMKKSKDNSYPKFKSWSDRLQVKISGPHWLDVTHMNANKGVGISTLQKEYGLTPKQTMVFGDNFNDVEMLQSAYYSYAMGNAHPDIQKTARFVANTNDEAGVLQVLKQVIAAYSSS